MLILKEYPKEEIIQFFKSVVNPALKDCDAELKRTRLGDRSPDS
jgi:hypothetical protein